MSTLETPPTPSDAMVPVTAKSPTSQKPSKVFPVHRWLLRKLLRSLGNPAIEIELWNGEVIGATSDPLVRVRFLDRAAFHSVVLHPDPGFADMYCAGRIEVEGNLAAFLEAVFRLYTPQYCPKGWFQWLQLPKWTRKANRENIHHHYDIGNDFYRLWLDEQMVYTCAYFPTPETGLEEAQVAKMEHVARKVRLRPGQKVIEAGCGWGALSLHMASRYGVHVRAFNISREQLAYARERAKEMGLSDRVEFIDDDYRNIQGECDAFVSVGMLEHVGLKNLRELGAVIARTLKPGGLGLIHSISRNFPSPMSPWMEQRIFPGSYIPALREMLDIFEPYNFSVLDVENIRLHYAKTLKHWLDRFDAVVEKTGLKLSDEFVRTWRLYLISSMAAFKGGLMQLFQVVFARAENNDIPWTRQDIYQQGETQ